MDINRLRWASRRGMLELDLVLQPFLENVYPDLPQQDKESFWQLLECEDQELFNWFMRKAEPEGPSLMRIVKIILDNTGMKIES